ncbi:MAG: sigma-E processing peptidase SpoIIGA [Clostridia bacterium]|nr:sigma-E processing peptidase SpoIIGA [Clostridia bacterium]
MVQAEAYWLWNAAMCACALPLGGKMAGLAAPGMKPLLWSAGLDGALALICSQHAALTPLALLGLPGAVIACFRANGWQACVRCTVTTLLSGMLTGGAMTACLNLGAAPVTAGVLAIGMSLTAYLLMNLIPNVLCNVRQVELRVEDRHIILPAMLDSGNLLRDPITGLPVLVIPARAARTLYPHMGDPSRLTELPLGFRLLNVRTAAGTALLPMFRPDECRIYLNGSACRADSLVAVAGREYGGVQALVPMSVLPAGAMPT